MSQSTKVQELLNGLPTAAPRVLRARLAYAATTRDRVNGVWDIRFDGRKIQIRIAVKERADGGFALTMAYRPRDLGHVIARIAVAGGWNALTFGRLGSDWTEADLDRLLADFRLELHRDVTADRLLAA